MKHYLKILHVITIVTFLVVILTPMVNQQFGIFKEVKGNENRKKTDKPVFDITNLDTYTEEYDDYYTDNFNLRQNFVSFIHRIDFLFFKISPVPRRVTFGKDGWIYATKSAKNYKGDNLFSEIELYKIQKEIELRTKWAKDRGIQYYVVIVPNKMNIYPEHLPNQIIKISNSSRYDQIKALDSYSDINVIDIKQNILKHKNDGYDLYQHTDDHWNDLGAYYGYQEIMTRLNEKFQVLKPYPLTDYEITTQTKQGNLASIINASNDYPENFIKLKEINQVYAVDGEKRGYDKTIKTKTSKPEIVKINSNADSLVCLVIRDSFGVFLVRFLQEHFKKTVFIHDGWEYKMNDYIIDIEQPDIILNVILETEVHKLLYNSFIKTTDIYYKALTNDSIKIEGMRIKAKKQNFSIDETSKRTALWLYKNRKSKGLMVMETQLYYEFLYEFDKDYKKQAEKLASDKNISFNQAVKFLATQEFNKNL